MDDVTIGLALAAGILSFISPCVLPLVPAYIGYMGGRLTHDARLQSASGGGAPASLARRLQMLLHGIAFVLGFTIIFVLVGLFTTALSSLAGAHVSAFTETLGRVGGAVIIFFGFQFMGVLPRFFAWLRQKRQAAVLDSVLLSIGFAIVASALLYWAFLEEIGVALPLSAALLAALFLKGAFSEPARFWHGLLDKLDSMLYSDTRADIGGGGRGGLLGSAFMGMVFSAGWTPCIGPLLGTILTLAAASGASSGDIAQGMLLLTAYSFGLGIPFLVAALLMDGAQGLLRRLQARMRKIELFSGSLLVAIGILVASGQLQSLSQTFSRGDFADFSFRVEECGVGFLEGKLGLSHVGACLGGSLAPVAINQSASGRFSPDMPIQEYLFHGEAGRVIDVELRSVKEEAPGFDMMLYGPGDVELARAGDADSLESEGRHYPLARFELESGGVYRLVLRNESASETARFRIKIRDAAPIAAAPAISEPPAGEDAPADSAIPSFGDIVADLQPAIGLAVGNRAPAFTITTLDDEVVSLADLRGSIALLNFWGTWCGPCRREMPEFEKAYDHWRDRGIEILAIAYNDTEAAMAAFREEFELSFALALDESGEINDAYGIQTRPSSYLLDGDGVILARHFGLMTESQLSDLLREAFAEA